MLVLVLLRKKKTNPPLRTETTSPLRPQRCGTKNSHNDRSVIRSSSRKHNNNNNNRSEKREATTISPRPFAAAKVTEEEEQQQQRSAIDRMI